MDNSIADYIIPHRVQFLVIKQPLILMKGTYDILFADFLYVSFKFAKK
jgi:hypothetical protein